MIAEKALSFQKDPAALAIRPWPKLDFTGTDESGRGSSLESLVGDAKIYWVNDREGLPYIFEVRKSVCPSFAEVGRLTVFPDRSDLSQMNESVRKAYVTFQGV